MKLKNSGQVTSVGVFNNRN